MTCKRKLKLTKKANPTLIGQKVVFKSSVGERLSGRVRGIVDNYYQITPLSPHPYNADTVYISTECILYLD